MNASQRHRIDPACHRAGPSFPRRRRFDGGLTGACLPRTAPRARPFAGTAVLAGFLLVLAGCVTINIYFPAAAAEKAADRIIDEVWQLDPKRGDAGERPASN